MRAFFVCLFFGCLVFFLAVPPAHAMLSEADKVRLQAEYEKIQAEIVEWQKVLDETREKKRTLQGDVTGLNALIKKAEAELRQRSVTITRLSDEIAEKTEKISEYEDTLARGRVSLAELLRLQREIDDRTFAEFLLGSDSFTDLYGDIERIAVVRRDLEKKFVEVRTVKELTESEKAALAEKRNLEIDARYDVEQTRSQIATNQEEKKKLLSITQNQERAYASVLAERQRKAEEIRSALFPLRDAEGISFGTALRHAVTAEQKTGVRAALVLAILSQESDLGKNVGSCLVTDLASGDGVGKNTGRRFEQVMKSPRDTQPFERITAALGMAWATTPVSCPLGARYTASRGFGGAMGPSQFIPSTWVLYEERIKVALGLSAANPWDAEQAIMATALYLADVGAAGGTYTAERNAACRYYSGRACDSRRPINYTYGDSVIKKREAFQNNIEFLRDN
ncbi:lytic murein transglycosylase [Patescibacteria group bacterium]|nr:lytic murein transglycosylase [Patescibacteria group bacterium]